MTSTATKTPNDLFKDLAGQIQEHLDLNGQIDEDAVRTICKDEISMIDLPAVTIRVESGGEAKEIKGSHEMLSKILRKVSQGFNNLLLVGPAGTGKSSLGKHIAEALGRDYGQLSLSEGVSEVHVLGRVLPTESGAWLFKGTRFLELYEKGGVFLLDEFDSADPNVMVALNSALANGTLTNPMTGELHTRHAEFVVVAAANTWGTGATAQYCGRNKLDDATMDRFVGAKIEVNYDAKIERGIARAYLNATDAGLVLDFVASVRKAITKGRLQRVASTRMIEAACKMMAGEDPDSWTDVKADLLLGWTEAEIAKVDAK